MGDAGLDFDTVVVGAGPAGLAAACAVAESGARVAVIDDAPWLGGQIWRGQTTQATLPQARLWVERFQKSGATLLDRTMVIAAPMNEVLLVEHADGPRRIRWQRLVLATGARELFLPFPGWTLPGVFGAGGLQSMVKQGWPIQGKRVVIAGSGPLLLAVADGLREQGARVVCIAEQTPQLRVLKFCLDLASTSGKLREAIGLRWRLRSVPYRCGTWPVGAEGGDQVGGVRLTDGRRTWTEPCDMLACGFGLVPNVELPLALGCKLKGGFVSVDKWQATSRAQVYCAGEPTGIGGVDCALVEGRIAGYAASGQAAKAEALWPERARWHRFRSDLQEAFQLRAELKSVASDATLLCRCEDVSLGRVRQFHSWREAKLQTRCGMGACQGRICGSASEFLLGWGMESVRPPVLPACVGSLVSRDESVPRE